MSPCHPLPRERRLRKDDEGQALVLGALGMVVLLLMAGLGVDVGYLRYQRQQMQKAADAGALAGAAALIYYRGGVGQAQVIAASRADATANGYTHGQDGITVQVNHPPMTNNDPFRGDPNDVEVIVSQERPTFFMRLLGYNTVNVSTRAIATSVGSGSGCLYSLATTGSSTFDVEAGSRITSNCGILIASTSSSAFNAGTGSSVTVSTGGIGIVGDSSGSGTLDPQPTTGIAPFTDPLSNVPAPTVPQCRYTQQYTVTRTGSIDPSGGAFCGGISISGDSGTVVTLQPGTYFVMNGLNVSGSPTIVGSGVTIYNTGTAAYPYAPVNLTGSASTNISAPAGGDLAGILIFQDRSILNDPRPNNVDGSRGQIYTGALYFPTTTLQYRGAPIVNPYELLIAWRLQFLGFTTLANHYQSLQDGGSPVQNATLVE